MTRQDLLQHALAWYHTVEKLDDWAQSFADKEESAEQLMCRSMANAYLLMANEVRTLTVHPWVEDLRDEVFDDLKAGK